jgi:hypothetical protein
MTRIRLIVGLITHIVIYLSRNPEAKARVWAVVPLMMTISAFVWREENYENPETR